MNDARLECAPGAVRRTVARALGLDPDELTEHDDLFALGLDSLHLLRLAAGWRRAGIPVTFEDLVEGATLADWYALLDERAAARDASAAATTPVPPEPSPARHRSRDPHAPFPLATMQHAYWSGRQDGQPLGGVGAHFYTEFDGAGLDPERLRAALTRLTRRHGMLRVRIDEDGMQRQSPTADTELVVHDLRAASADDVDSRLEALRHAWSHQRMDPAAGEVLRVGLSLLPGGRTRLHVDLDMIAGDAVSLRILLADLARFHADADADADAGAGVAALAEATGPAALAGSAASGGSVVPVVPAGSAVPGRSAASAASAGSVMPVVPGGKAALAESTDSGGLGATSESADPADPAESAESADPTWTYADYLAAHEPARAADREQAASWWTERLPELPPPPRLPTLVDELAPIDAADTARNRTIRLHHRLDPEAKAELTARCRRFGVTVPAALTTVFAEVMGVWSAEPRFTLNVPLFDRQPLHPDVADMVGDFSGSVLLAVDTADELPFSARAKRVQGDLRAAVAHGAYGGVDVLRDLSRAQGRPVLAPVVHTSAVGLGEVFDAAVRETFGAPVWIISQGPQVWLDAQITELDGGLLLNWDVRAGMFPPGLPEAAFAAYRDLVDRVTWHDAAWHTPVGDLTPAAQRAVRPGVVAPVAAPRTLHGRFFDNAATHPDRIALIHEDGTELTYAALADRARRLAAALAARGVRPRDTVAVTLPKGGAQAVAVLAVLAAGAAYAPVGIDQPPRRRRAMLDTAGAAVVLTDAEHAPLSDEIPGLTTVVVDGFDGFDGFDGSPGLDAHEPARVVPGSPDDTAYVIFTSGSTGVPKGVDVPHRAVANTVDAVGDRYAIGPDDRTLALSALDFDLSAYDMFAFWSVGGCVVAVDEAHRRDAAHWAALIRRHRVTILSCVPALLDMLLDAAGDDGLGGTPRLVMLGGDWAGLEQPERLRKFVPDCGFAVLGGMTEAAIHATVFDVDTVDPAWRSIPYGAPLPGTRARVVDPRGRDRPDHVPGELWVGGAGVADGYRGDPARTRERFVDHDGVRWYRSGDLARYGSDGVLEFLGRADHQVKIRGHRIELGEVEAAFDSHPAVLHAVAAVLEQPARRLAVALSTHRGAALDPSEVTDWAAQRLPAFMLPAHVHVWDAIPVTANGKLDRRAVADRLAGAQHARELPGTPPRGEVESLVAKVWGELLGSASVGRDDTFFELGGDSLVATRMAARLRAEGLSGARVAAVFAAPRLADFAARLGRSTAAATTDATPALVPRPERRHEPFPLTDVQTAYLSGRDPAFPLGGVGTWHYTEFDDTDVHLPRLERALRALVARHDMLRCVVLPDGTQRVLDEPPHVAVDVTETDAAGAEAALAALRADTSHRIHDPALAPPFVCRAVRYPDADGGTRTRVAIGLDYLGLDALSIMTLYAELDRLYRDIDAPLPPLDATFRDYVTQIRPTPEDERRSWEHWSARIAELPPPPALPAGAPVTDIEQPRFTRRTFVLPPARWDALRTVARRHRVTPSALLLALYGEVLAAWSGTRAVTVTQTLFDRREAHPHIGRVLGDFTALAPVAYHRADGTLADAVTALQRRQADDLDHRDAPVARLLREAARRFGGGTVSPVVFTSALGVGGLTGGDEVSLDLHPDFPTRVFGVSQSPQVCLDNQVTVEHGGLRVVWDAVDELFAPGVLDAMADAYRRLLDHVAEFGLDTAVPDLRPPASVATRRRANDTASPIEPRPLHAAFFDRAREHPDRTALIGADGTTTSYGRLAERALRVATFLRARGEGPGATVAVRLPKGPDQIAAVLGVLAAGATYVPLGLDQPPLRRARILQAARARTVVDAAVLAEADTAPPLAAPDRTDPAEPAYVIFTSGSTGEPKGVEVSHAAAWNTIADVNARHAVGPDDRVLALSSLDFDLSVYDVFGPLAAGGAVVVPDEDDRREPARWRQLVREHRVTLWNSVPVLLDMLLGRADDTPAPESLRVALVSGDWIGLDLPGRLRTATGGRCRLTALGGATEAAIWSNSQTVHAVPPHWTSIPYGLPLANQRFRVVDPDGRDCPDLVPGELWIGGAGVALGYRGDPARTAERFVTHDGTRWYRTGDLGRYQPDGTLEFLGRADDQVKIAGNRVEVGEVEAALQAHPGIAGAAVVKTGHHATGSLVAFVTAPDGPPPDLAAWLADRLPPYALPTAITPLDTLPLTANGKIDRSRLARHAGAARPVADDAGEPCAGATEQAIAALWADHLGTPPAGRHHNFFTAGGDSLAALRFIATIEHRFATAVRARDFLAAPTVAALAARLGGADHPRRELPDDPDDPDATEYESGTL
ncbi:amino acid adenylation domain-containing protein [Yinghuangia sp. ASG 101]|uniref:non-ribosomal peptide synthetase n=1 Tax=Yinghuangia sp. ASG 101 TaxID=2896848 RepID=UPI001E43DD73|nr:non-ribosomal peptide synthetase [Yinghuangia sp. ASG 101]UGQ12386.1 amino acid adenylation domain-containing protein [Yinghuangia sp. ASG 101]